MYFEILNSKTTHIHAQIGSGKVYPHLGDSLIGKVSSSDLYDSHKKISSTESWQHLVGFIPFIPIEMNIVCATRAVPALTTV